MLEDLPPVSSGYIRLVLFPDSDTRDLLHADVLKWCDTDLDLLGHIQIRRRKVYIDVHHTISHELRERLNFRGRCTVAENSLHDMEWHFVRLGVGRNHGLNLGLLKKLIKKYEAGPIGKISINNSYTLIGIREDKIKSLLENLKTHRINGYASQARLANEREIGKKEAKFVPNKPADDERRDDRRDNYRDDKRDSNRPPRD